MDNFQHLIRELPDFPQKGILFYDINPLLSNWKSLNAISFSLAEKIAAIVPYATKVLSIEARGFIIGGILSNVLEAGFVPIRKKGKLPPYDTLRNIEYQLEYGTDSLSIDVSLINYHDNIVIFDDVLATGGTAEATYKLLKNEINNGKLAAFNKHNICFAFLLEIEKLKGRAYLSRQTGIPENNIISLIVK